MDQFKIIKVDQFCSCAFFSVYIVAVIGKLSAIVSGKRVGKLKNSSC